mgnify:CR=1 FL=1
MALLNTVRAIALKDLKIRARDPGGLVLMFVVPLLVITIASFALSPLYSRSAGRLRLPLVDLDRGDVAREVARRLGEVPGLVLEATHQVDGVVRPMDLAEARRRIRAGARFGALMLPAGTSAALAAGKPSTLVLLQDPADPATTALLYSIMNAVTVGLSAEEATARVLGRAEPGLSHDDARLQARTRLGHGALTVKQESVIPRLRRHITPFQQNVPGVAVTFALLMTITAGLSLLREQGAGTMRRILLAPVSRASVLLGKLLPVYLLTLAQLLVLLLFGNLVLGVDLGTSPVGLALVVMAVAAAPPALGLMAAALVRSEAQLLSASILIIMVMSALGGSWWPLELVPDGLRTLAYVFTINAWAMDGLKDLLWYGRGVVDVLPEVGVLVGISLAALALGTWRFRWT